MHDEPIDAGSNENIRRRPSRFERLASSKLSLPIVVGFFGFLVVVSAAATGVSYLVHHFLRR